jgi:hypothetical protein
MNPRKILAVLVIITLLCVVPTTIWAQSSKVTQDPTAGATGDFIEQLAKKGHATYYAQVLRYFKDSPAQSIAELSKNLDAIRKAAKDLFAGIDMAKQMAAGKFDEAAISSALYLLDAFVGANTDKLTGLAFGIPAVTFSTAIVAFKVWRDSEKELYKSTVAVKLQSLYGTIEADRVLKPAGRQLGQGDPIPPTAANVDYLWKKVITESSFREMFRIYVTEELGKKWPEPSYWERLTLSTGLLEEAKLMEDKEQVKSNIQGLLRKLNDLRKTEEQMVLARQAIISLQKELESISEQELTSAIEKFAEASKRLPDVEKLTGDCAREIEKAKQQEKENNIAARVELDKIMGSCKVYARDVVAYLPDQGLYSDTKKKLVEGLKSCYSRAEATYREMQVRFNEQVLKDAETPVRDIAGAKKAPPVQWEVRRYPFTVTLNDVKTEAYQELRDSAGTDKTVQKLHQVYQTTISSKYEADKARITAEYEKLRVSLKAKLDSFNKACEQRNQSACDGIYETMVEMDLVPSIYQNTMNKLEGYRKVDESLYIRLRDELNAYYEYLTGFCRENNTLVYAGDQGYKGIRRIRAELAEIKEKSILAIEDAMIQVRRQIPDASYGGIGRLVFPKEAQRGAGTPDWKKILAGYMEYIDGRGSPIGQFTSLPVDFSLRHLENTLQLILAFQGLEKQIKELEKEVGKAQAIYASSCLGVNKSEGNSVKGSIDELEQMLKEIKEFQQKVGGYESSCRAKLQGYSAGIDDTRSDLALMQSLKRILEKSYQTLNSVSNKYRRRNASQYELKPASKEYLFSPPESSLSCDTLLTKKTFLTKKETDEAAGGIMAELTAIPGLREADRLYALQVEQIARKYVENYFADIYSAEHYIFLPVDRACLLFTREDFDGLTKRVQDIQVEKMGHEHVLIAEMIRILGDDGLATFMGMKRIGTDSNRTTRDFVAIANKAWDGETKVSIGRFSAAVEGKFDSIRSLSARWAGIRKEVEDLKSKITDLSNRADWRGIAGLEGSVLGTERKIAGDTTLPEYDRNTLTSELALLKKKVEDAKLATSAGGTAGPQQGPSATPATVPAATVNKVKDFYRHFQDVYQARDDAGVVQCLSNDWSGGDGSTISELQASLRRSFRLFNEVRYQIANLTVNPASANTFRVSYDVTIIGRIFARNIKHEEKSTVEEIVTLDSRDKVRILKTVNGRFWYVK